MPRVQFDMRQSVIEIVDCELEIPQDVFDAGGCAIDEYIIENSDHAEHVRVKDSYITESFLECEVNNVKEVK
jgi:hypothetical protein